MANFYARITQAASAFGDRPAIEFAGARGLETTTYRQLIVAAEDASRELAALGVGLGDRVAILAPNSARWVAWYLGILRQGAVAVPLDTAYTEAQVQTIVADCGAKAVVRGDRVSSVKGDRVSAILQGDPVSYVGDTVADTVADTDIATILYTSGTTADPKGVVLTHDNWEAERAAALSVIHVTETDVVLGVLPLFHALAQMANLLLPLTTGARVVFLETSNSTTLLEALQARNATIFACVPQFFYLIHQRVLEQVARRGALTRRLFRALVSLNGAMRDRLGVNLGRTLFAQVHHALGPRMRLLITGGSRFDPTIARDLYGMGLVLLNGYGLTETSGAATVQRPGDRFSTSVGAPLPGVEVRIVSATQETGSRPGMREETRSPRRHGEILIRGPIVMREYFNRPDVTREAIRDGWLHTGDLGFLDDQGRLHITGRLKDVIVLSSGKNLYPEEIEAHYRRSPFIKEVCVLGVTTPEDPTSERLHAIVVPDEDTLRARGIVNVRELIRFEIETLSVQLPAHKRVLGYDIRLQSLPRTTTGKLKRGEVAAVRRATVPAADRDRALTASEEAWRHDGSHAATLDLIARRLGRSTVAPDANLELDLGLDSMERVELLAFLEQRFGRRMPPEARATIFTARQLIDAIEDADGAAGPTGPRDTPASPSTADEWHALLAQPAPAALTDPLGRHAAIRSWIVGVALRVLLAAARLVVRVDVSGLERLPRRGPYLICPNHQSHLDGFVLSALIPIDVLRQVFLIGASEYFETSFAARVARFINVVPVDPDANLVTAMRAAATGLRQGRILVVFPEGERTIDGTIKPFRKGAAILATELDVAVVPVAIDGLFGVWPRGRGVNWRTLRPWRRAPVRLRIGPAFKLPPGDPAAGAEILRRAVEGLTP